MSTFTQMHNDYLDVDRHEFRFKKRGVCTECGMFGAHTNSCPENVVEEVEAQMDEADKQLEQWEAKQ